MPVEHRASHSRRSGFGAAAGAIAIAIAFGTLFHTPEPAFAQTDPGSIGVRLIDVPASAANDPRARQYIVDHLEPGSVIERQFEISNTTASATTVEVYPSAATIDHGAFVGDAGKSVNELTEHTTIGQTTVVIPASSTITNSVTIAIPEDAPPGEQYGAIWVEARSAENSGVEIVNRVGIRMYVSIGGANPPASDFAIESMTASRDSVGAPSVTASIRNTGGRALDTSAALTLTKVGGTLSAGPYTSASGGTIAPGETTDLVIAVTDDVDAGPWTASIAVTSGLLEVRSEAEVTFPAEGQGQKIDTEVPFSNLLQSAWAGLLAAIILGLAILAWLIVRRRSRSQRDGAGRQDPGAAYKTTNNDVPR